MSKYIPTQTKTFGGKRYTIATVKDTKREAEAYARGVRTGGSLARVVRIPKAPKGQAGYIYTRWAIYTRKSK